MICPCKACEDRHEACHDRCERYKAWAAARQKANEARRLDKMFSRSDKARARAVELLRRQKKNW